MPSFNPDLHHRRSVRLKWHDYADAGWYAVTVCTHERLCLLGSCTAGTVVLSTFGQVVQAAINALGESDGHAAVDISVVMPNHVHLVLVLRGGLHSRNSCAGSAPRGPAPCSLGALISTFKARTTQTINRLRGTPGQPVWQRSYWDRVIRDEAELQRIREYVSLNPARWAEDKYNV